MSELDKLRDLEEKAYTESTQILGDATSMVDTAIELYDLLIELAPQGARPSNDVVAEAFLLFQCRYHLVQGSMTLLRRHGRDAHGHVRQAVEACAFARRIKKHPHLADVWLEDLMPSGPTQEKVRDKFGPKHLFPPDDEKLTQLKEWWDLTARASHSSFFALAQGFVTKKEPGRTGIGLSYFDVPNPEELLRQLVYLVKGYFLILRVFEDVFPESIEVAKGRWNLKRDVLEAQIRVRLEQLGLVGSVSV